MIDRECDVAPPAELAPVPVSPKNVLSGENDILVWDFYIDSQPQNARERHRTRHTPQYFPVAAFKQFGLSKKQEHNCFPRTNNAHRLVVLVQHQDFGVEPTIGAMCPDKRAEDDSSSYKKC